VRYKSKWLRVIFGSGLANVDIPSLLERRSIYTMTMFLGELSGCDDVFR
jgi:hypothetical protein